ncbi:hypothetical protein WDU94_008112 [Cyamophila willieti]
MLPDSTQKTDNETTKTDNEQTRNTTDTKNRQNETKTIHTDDNPSNPFDNTKLTHKSETTLSHANKLSNLTSVTNSDNTTPTVSVSNKVTLPPLVFRSSTKSELVRILYEGYNQPALNALLKSLMSLQPPSKDDMAAIKEIYTAIKSLAFLPQSLSQKKIIPVQNVPDNELTNVQNNTEKPLEDKILELKAKEKIERISTDKLSNINSRVVDTNQVKNFRRLPSGRHVDTNTTQNRSNSDMRHEGDDPHGRRENLDRRLQQSQATRDATYYQGRRSLTRENPKAAFKTLQGCMKPNHANRESRRPARTRTDKLQLGTLRPHIVISEDLKESDGLSVISARSVESGEISPTVKKIKQKKNASKDASEASLNNLNSNDLTITGIMIPTNSKQSEDPVNPNGEPWHPSSIESGEIESGELTTDEEDEDNLSGEDHFTFSDEDEDQVKSGPLELRYNRAHRPRTRSPIDKEKDSRDLERRHSRHSDHRSHDCNVPNEYKPPDVEHWMQTNLSAILSECTRGEKREGMDDFTPSKNLLSSEMDKNNPSSFWREDERENSEFSLSWKEKLDENSTPPRGRVRRDREASLIEPADGVEDWVKHNFPLVVSESDDSENHSPRRHKSLMSTSDKSFPHSPGRHNELSPLRSKSHYSSYKSLHHRPRSTDRSPTHYHSRHRSKDRSPSVEPAEDVDYWVLNNFQVLSESESDKSETRLLESQESRREHTSKRHEPSSSAKSKNSAFPNEQKKLNEQTKQEDSKALKSNEMSIESLATKQDKCVRTFTVDKTKESDQYDKQTMKPVTTSIFDRLDPPPKPDLSFKDVLSDTLAEDFRTIIAVKHATTKSIFKRLDPPVIITDTIIDSGVKESKSESVLYQLSGSKPEIVITKMPLTKSEMKDINEAAEKQKASPTSDTSINSENVDTKNEPIKSKCDFDSNETRTTFRSVDDKVSKKSDISTDIAARETSAISENFNVKKLETETGTKVIESNVSIENISQVKESNNSIDNKTALDNPPDKESIIEQNEVSLPESSNEFPDINTTSSTKESLSKSTEIPTSDELSVMKVKDILPENYNTSRDELGKELVKELTSKTEVDNDKSKHIPLNQDIGVKFLQNVSNKDLTKECAIPNKKGPEVNILTCDRSELLSKVSEKASSSAPNQVKIELQIPKTSSIFSRLDPPAKPNQTNTTDLKSSAQTQISNDSIPNPPSDNSTSVEPPKASSSLNYHSEGEISLSDEDSIYSTSHLFHDPDELMEETLRPQYNRSLQGIPSLLDLPPISDPRLGDTFNYMVRQYPHAWQNLVPGPSQQFGSQDLNSGPSQAFGLERKGKRYSPDNGQARGRRGHYSRSPPLLSQDRGQQKSRKNYSRSPLSKQYGLPEPLERSPARNISPYTELSRNHSPPPRHERLSRSISPYPELARRRSASRSCTPPRGRSPYTELSRSRSPTGYRSPHRGMSPSSRQSPAYCEDISYRPRASRSPYSPPHEPSGSLVISRLVSPGPPEPERFVRRSPTPQEIDLRSYLQSLQAPAEPPEELEPILCEVYEGPTAPRDQDPDREYLNSLRAERSDATVTGGGSGLQVSVRFDPESGDMYNIDETRYRDEYQDNEYPDNSIVMELEESDLSPRHTRDKTYRERSSDYHRYRQSNTRNRISNESNLRNRLEHERQGDFDRQHRSREEGQEYERSHGRGQEYDRTNSRSGQEYHGAQGGNNTNRERGFTFRGGSRESHYGRGGHYHAETSGNRTEQFVHDGKFDPERRTSNEHSSRDRRPYQTRPRQPSTDSIGEIEDIDEQEVDSDEGDLFNPSEEMRYSDVPHRNSFSDLFDSYLSSEKEGPYMKHSPNYRGARGRGNYTSRGRGRGQGVMNHRGTRGRGNARGSHHSRGS